MPAAQYQTKQKQNKHNIKRNKIIILSVAIWLKMACKARKKAVKASPRPQAAKRPKPPPVPAKPPLPRRCSGKKRLTAKTLQAHAVGTVSAAVAQPVASASSSGQCQTKSCKTCGLPCSRAQRYRGIYWQHSECALSTRARQHVQRSNKKVLTKHV